MTKRNEKLVEFPRQSARDILTDVLRDGAQQMLATAIDPLHRQPHVSHVMHPAASDSSPADERPCAGQHLVKDHPQTPTRQPRKNVPSTGGTSFGSVLQSGSMAMTWANVFDTSSPTNGRVPVSIS